MANRLVTMRLEESESTPAEVAKKLNVNEDDIDPTFGVVLIDPDQNLYAIRVDENLAVRVSANDEVNGPFVDVPIQPFGPPEHED